MDVGALRIDHTGGSLLMVLRAEQWEIEETEETTRQLLTCHGNLPPPLFCRDLGGTKQEPRKGGDGGEGELGGRIYRS